MNPNALNPLLVFEWLGVSSGILIAQIPEVSQPPTSGDAGATGLPSAVVEFLAYPLNLILIGVIIFMLFVARPQKTPADQQDPAELKNDDRVITSSGIHGVVVQIDPDNGPVRIRIDDTTGACMTVNRDAITQIIPTDS